MNVTSEKLFKDTLNNIISLQNQCVEADKKYKEFRQAMNEEKAKSDRLQNEISLKKVDCELFNKYGNTYVIVCNFYKNSMRQIHETIPNICTSLSMRLITKAITRGANIFEGYNSVDELRSLNKNILTIFDDVEKKIGGDIFKNYEFLQRILIKKIDDLDYRI